jgi:hypothetical protein
MSEVSVTGAAFAGLRALRQRPATLLVWYVLVVVATLGMMAGFANLAGPAMVELQAVQSSGAAADPQAAMAATASMMGGFLLMIPVYLLFGAVTTAAANRLILRPQASGFGYLRLGADELRLIVVMLVVGLICGLVYIVGAVVAGIAGVAASGGFSSGPPDPARIIPIYLLCLLPFAAVIIWMLLKFSLAPAHTIDTRSISIFGSWGLTKGHLGKVFLTYLLAIVVYCVISVAGMAIVFAVWKAMGSDKGFKAVMQPEMTSVAAVLAGPMIVYFLVMGLVSALGLALLASPGAALYQQITGRTAEEIEA